MNPTKCQGIILTFWTLKHFIDVLFNTLHQLHSYSISLSSKAVTDDTNGGAATGLTDGGATNLALILGISIPSSLLICVLGSGLGICLFFYIKRRTGEYCFISNILLDLCVCVFVLFLNYILANALA